MAFPSQYSAWQAHMPFLVDTDLYHISPTRAVGVSQDLPIMSWSSFQLCRAGEFWSNKNMLLELQTWISDVGKLSQVLLSFLKQFSNKHKLRLNHPPTKMREVTNYNLAIDPYNLERSLFRNECGVFFVCVCVHGTKWFTLYLHPQKWSEKIGHFLSQICDMIPAPPGQPWMQPVCDLRNSFQLSNNSKSDAERVSRFLSLFNLSNKKNANRSTEFSASPWHHLTWSVQGSGSGLLHAMNSGGKKWMAHSRGSQSPLRPPNLTTGTTGPGSTSQRMAMNNENWCLVSDNNFFQLVRHGGMTHDHPWLRGFKMFLSSKGTVSIFMSGLISLAISVATWFLHLLGSYLTSVATSLAPLIVIRLRCRTCSWS